MSLIQVVGGFFSPPRRHHSQAITTVSNPLTTATQQYALIIRAPKQGVLDKFEFRTGAASSIAGGSSIRASFQSVNSALDPAVPDGIVDQFRLISGGSFPSGTWIAPGLITSDGTDTGTKRSVLRNELLALVIDYSVFTAADSLQLAGTTGTSASDSVIGLAHFPYLARFSGSAWARITSSILPFVALKYDDGSYEGVCPEIPPISAAVDVQFADSSTPDERGARFRFPFPVRVAGCWILRNLASAGAYDVVLYDEDGSTPLETISIDPDQGVDVASQEERIYIKFAASHDLAAGSWYRLTVLPTSGTNTRYLAMTVASAALLDALPGGQDWHATSRTDAGAWTDTTTEHPLMGLHITAVAETEAGSGGGGGGGFVAVARGYGRGMV